MENITDDRLFEQIRNDYSKLKEQLSKQQIINDRLMNSVFRSKVRRINSVAWTSAACGVFTILVAPIAFHYNPVMNLSWAFVIGTDIMMLVSIAGMSPHIAVKVPPVGESMVDFAQSVKALKKRYQNWTRFAVILISVWMTWMLTELFMKTDNPKLAICVAAGLICGLVIGGVLGLMANKKVINTCDEILDAIEED